MNKKNVLVFTTGGTISSKTHDNTSGYSPAVKGADLIKGIKDIDSLCNIEVEEFCSVLSFSISPAMILRLSSKINDIIKQSNYDAIVVTHGTATMEESAFLTDILTNTEKPIVFTGSMRPASEPDSDGPRNIFNAISVAISEEAKGKGVLVCLDEDIHFARDVLKLHKTRLSTFYSPQGKAGIIEGGKVVFYRQPYEKCFIKTEKLEEKVGFIKVVAGMDSFLIESLLNQGIKGLVIEGLPGNGAVTPGVMEGIKLALKESVVVVFGSRSPYGRLIASAGGGTGPKDLLSVGAISCGDISPVKARLVLMAALGAGKKDFLYNLFSKIVC